MGHKTVVVLDNDLIDLILENPVGFATKLHEKVLTFRRTGGNVSVKGDRCIGTVANVVWQGHVDQTPNLKFVDFSIEEVK